MSDKKIVDITQLNKSIEEQKSDLVTNELEYIANVGDTIPLEEVEQLPRINNKIDIRYITLGKSKRSNDIVRDDIFDAYFNILPDKVENKTGSWRTVSKNTPESKTGKIKILGGDPINDIDIQRKGAETLNASKAQRRTFAEVIEEMLVSRASKESIEEFQLRPDATNLEMIIASAARQAGRGNVRAMDFIRDTIGQKPSENINAAITGLTEEDKQMLANIQERLSRKD